MLFGTSKCAIQLHNQWEFLKKVVPLYHQIIENMNCIVKGIAVLVLILISTVSFAQMKTYTGKIVDETSNESIPYVTVVLVSKTTTEVLDGTTTGEDGMF